MKRVRSLYELGEEFEVLEQLLDEAAEAGTADLAVAEIVAKWLTELEGELELKLERCIRYVQSLEALAAARRAESKRLSELAQVCDQRIETMRAGIKALFQRTGHKKVETLLGVVRLKKAGGKRALEVLVPVSQLPESFVVREPEADRGALYEAALLAEELGHRDDFPFARLKPQGVNIEIARK